MIFGQEQMMRMYVHINSTNSMVVTNLVEKLEQFNRVSSLLIRGSNLDGQALLKKDSEVKRLVRGLKGVDSLSPKILGRSVVRVLKNTSLVRAMNQVLVLAPWSLRCG
jgi:hypothetical protein